MQSIISYDDKTALYENPSIPDINKVNASDMNEIKSIVNGSLQGTNAMGSIVVDDINCKNLFDKDNYNSLGGFINSSTSKITGNANTLSVYIPIEANTTYTVSKTKGNRFAIATTSATPVFDISLSNIVENNTATSLTLTSSNSAKYLVAYVYNSGADTDTLDSILATLQIEAGSTATTYTPYKKIIKEENGYVKEDTTFYANDFKCKNLFDYNSSKFGYVLGSGGAESTASGFLISDYIPVTPNTTYTISRVFNNVSGAENSMRIGYYQQNKTFIDRPASSDNPYIITTPSNCYYVRLSYQYQSQGQTSNDKVQLEIGEATPYTPYVEVAPSVETIDISSYKTSNVSSVSRAFVQRVGHIYKFNIVCNVGSASSTGVTLFTGLPFTPAFITELDTVNANNVTTRCFYDSGQIKIGSAQASTYFINGTMII